jgi:hypothetical protein
MSPSEVAALLGGVGFPWWVAGGWAIDLHLGRQTRDHDDMDVLVLRDDQLALQQALCGWDLQAADPPGSLRPWHAGEVLPTEVHDIWCRREPGSPWSLQVMVDDAHDGIWQYRRDTRIKRPVSGLDGSSDKGPPQVLAPEIQLLQKSRSPRPKDEADFLAVRHSLTRDQREWLVTALTLVSPAHPWLGRL